MFHLVLLCRTRYYFHPLIILLLCCFSLCRSSNNRHSFLFPFLKGFTSVGETKRLQSAENRQSNEDDNYLQKAVLSNQFKTYRALNAFNKFSSFFEHNPFKAKAKGRSFSGTVSRINIYSDYENDKQNLKPPNVLIPTRNKTLFHQIINPKNLQDDEKPILIKNNHGKYSNFKFKPLNKNDFTTLMMTSRTTPTSDNSSKGDFSFSNENEYKASTKPTIFDDEFEVLNNNLSNETTKKLITTKSNKTTIFSIKNFNKPMKNFFDSSYSLKTTPSSIVINYPLTTGTTSFNKHTTLNSKNRTPAHVIITKKGNYTTNNSSKYFATPSYSLAKKKPLKFTIKPVIIDNSSKNVSKYNQTIINFKFETTTEIPKNITEKIQQNLDSQASYLQMFENDLNGNLIKNINKTSLILNNKTKNKNFTENQNLLLWPFKLPTEKNKPSVKNTTSNQQFSQKNTFPFFDKINKTSILMNNVTQRPILQVTQLSSVFTKPDSDLIQSGAITVMDHNSDQQSTQSLTSTTIMHNNLIVSYKPGRPLPENSKIGTSTPSYDFQQHQQNEQQVIQNNLNNDKDTEQGKLQTQQSIKSNHTLSKLPKPPIMHKPVKNQENNKNYLKPHTHHVNKNHQTSVHHQTNSINPQPPRRVGLPYHWTQQQHHIHQQQQLLSSSNSHNSTNLSSSHNSTSHQNHYHQPSGYVNAIFAPPMPSMPFTTPSPQITYRNPILTWLGVDSLSQLLDRSFFFRVFFVILTILLLPPLSVVAAITSFG